MSRALCVVGASGAVGQEIVALLARSGVPAERVRLLASARSAGTEMAYGDKKLKIQELSEAAFADASLALFAASGDVSRAFVPHATRAGAAVVDNSSAFRLDPNVPLVVPEVNGELLLDHPRIVANPNCSTILLAVALWPLHQQRPVRRVVVSTYQAASGAGAAAMAELEQQARDWTAGRPLVTDVVGKRYLWNVFSHNSDVKACGYNVEEVKMRDEIAKIFGEGAPSVAGTCVRVPVLRAHCESVNVEFADGEARPAEEWARRVLADAPGLRLVDDRASNRFPEPLDAAGVDEVLVGRVRDDPSRDGAIELFLSGDQILKGAALNAVQIAERLEGWRA